MCSFCALLCHSLEVTITHDKPHTPFYLSVCGCMGVIISGFPCFGKYLFVKGIERGEIMCLANGPKRKGYKRAAVQLDYLSDMKKDNGFIRCVLPIRVLSFATVHQMNL